METCPHCGNPLVVDEFADYITESETSPKTFYEQAYRTHGTMTPGEQLVSDEATVVVNNPPTGYGTGIQTVTTMSTAKPAPGPKKKNREKIVGQPLGPMRNKVMTPKKSKHIDNPNPDFEIEGDDFASSVYGDGGGMDAHMANLECDALMKAYEADLSARGF